MSNLETALEDCLARLEKGETLENCLARYPEHKPELVRLLGAASVLAPSKRVRPSPQFKARGRAQLVAHMRAKPRRRTQSVFAPFWGNGARLAVSLGAAFIIVLTLGTSAAQAALPGQALYGWKLTSEQVWRALSPDRLATDLALAQRRVDELGRVAGDPVAEAIAREGYDQALSVLNQYTDAESREIIETSLVEHQAALQETGVDVPQLNDLLSTLRPSVEMPVAVPTSTTADTLLPSVLSTSISTEILTSEPSDTREASATPTSTHTATAPTKTAELPILPTPTLPEATPLATGIPPIVATALPPPVATVVLPVLTNLPTLPLP